MSNPRTKRLFAGAAADPAQRNITSFFHKTSTPTSPTSATYAELEAEARELSPAPPADVQANLLSVGMRVRKSVPEGYKTGSVYSSFALWSDNPAGASQWPQQQHLRFGVTRAAEFDMLASVGGDKELLPFCGLHKVGGLASQPETSSAPLFPASVFRSAGTGSFDDDPCPDLMSSQDTVGSTLSAASSAATNRKRRAVGEDEEDVPEAMRPQQQVWRLGWCDGEVSPKTMVPAWGHEGRVMAVPRRRGARKTGVAVPGMSGQENTEVEVAGDFGEASFLDLGEVEMADG